MLAFAVGELSVELIHEQMGGLVVHLPQAHHQGAGTRFLEATLKAEHTVSGDVAQSGLACRHHHDVHPTEIQL